MESGLSTQEMAELAALADGTLPRERRAEVEARVAASPELRELLERQRRSLAATQALATEPAPAPLVETVEGLRSQRTSRRSGGRWFLPRLALGGGLAVVAAIVAAVVFTGGPGGPTVADAARLATTTPSGPPPPLADGSTKLAVDVDGVAFPNLERWAGWDASGVRRGRVDGRDATVVFYRKDGRRIGYVIVSGAGLPKPSGPQGTTRNGVGYQMLRLYGRLGVTWRRDGHTCVLLGDAARRELVRIASWKLS